MAKGDKEKDVKKNPLLDDEEETAAEGAGESSDEEAEEGDTEEVAPEPAKKPAARTTVRSTGSKAAVPAEVAAPARNTQEALLGDAKLTRDLLAKEPKVWFMVPLSPHEKEGAYEEVFINGYRTTIKKGVMVEIPRAVMELLANKYQIELEAGKDYRIDRNNRTEDALG